MTAITLTPFAGLVSDLLAAVSRLLGLLSGPDEMADAAERLSALDRDFTAIIVAVRRDLESLLSEGVPSKQFADKLSPVAASIKQELQTLQEQRAHVLTLPAPMTSEFLLAFDGLLAETRALDALLTATLAAARAPLPAGFWARAEEGAEGPFETHESVTTDLLGHGTH